MKSVVDSIDSSDNVYDIYYGVHECEDTDTGCYEPGGVLGGWDRVNHGPAGRGRVLSHGSESHSLFNAYDVYS